MEKKTFIVLPLQSCGDYNSDPILIRMTLKQKENHLNQTSWKE